MTHQRAVAGGALVTVASCVAAWALAYPAASLTAALPRAVADGAAVVTLGLAVVPVLDGPRYRDELVRRATAPLVLASAAWVVAELVRLALAGAEAAGTTVTGLGLREAWAFAAYTSPGRAGLLAVLAAAAVCAVTAAAPRSGPACIAGAGLACIGIVGHPLTGHLSGSVLGGVSIAVHALAAALWCGTLAGLVLTVDHRGQWARVLPRFSQLSLGCVAALLAGGIAAGVTVLGSPAALYATGYGRVLSVKIALTLVLIALAWRNRELWLPAARTHRSTAAVSRTRAYTELTLMAATLAAGAVLSVTG
ncbi:copper resistance D family protein [Mycolicibacterium austroafricanum]|uniref:copper resistance D family protein n=1 Tax=Mycolicibacterium austroafricanum TaxID=39687 RepID=UPI001CA35E60|nr:CopD family protein [Mycolicibacterium austroafricanum]QZT62644.1 CopD family protein [Mycolicibacterium austroafricanum]